MEVKDNFFIPFCLLFLSASVMAVMNSSGRRVAIDQGYLMGGKASRPEIIPASRPEGRIPPELLDELSRYRLEDILPVPKDAPKDS